MNFEYLFILETVVIFNVDTLPSQNRYLHFFEEGGGEEQMEFKSICFF